MAIGEMWAQLGSVLAGLMFIWAMVQQYTPYQFRGFFTKYSNKLLTLVYPFIQITFQEFSGERFKKSEAYSTIEIYLGASSTKLAKRLKGEMVKNCESLVLSMDDYEEVIDEFKGVKLWWSSSKRVPKTQSFSFYPAADEKRFYKLTFHRKNRDLVTGEYLKHVMNEGKEVAKRNRQRKLYTNNRSDNWYGYNRSVWSHVVFEHPATFDTLALTKSMKEGLLNDLNKFRGGKDYYLKVGKAWKRGYLLYGPPGTGKSTMIAAIANYMNYDIYDLELTSVKDNTELRKLLIETTSKSIVVIEDIDCSLDLTGQRKKKKKKEEKDENEEENDVAKEVGKGEKEKEISKVTLSGLLNFIDGLWSACGAERIIIFTTNFVDKLDPALVRRGRMDKHIEMGYCCFEAFEVLARNYLGLESHVLFPKIKSLLEEVEMTPADVAENLILKYSGDEEGKSNCLEDLIEALEKAKEEARKKREEEEKLKVENEVKLKGENEKELKELDVEKVKENGKLEEK